MKKTKKPAIPIGMGSFTVKPCLFPGTPVKVTPADGIHFLPITSECFDGSELNKFHLDEVGQWENIK